MTHRNHNRSRGIRSYSGVAGDCSADGAGKLSQPSRGASARPSDVSRETVPIWFAALTASDCQAKVDGEDHAVSWDCIAGRALYTNRGTAAERIEPLGVQLKGGHTVAVYWQPGNTDYTVEVYSQSNHFSA